MLRYALIVAALVATATLLSPSAYAQSNSPRVPAMYTTWDDYYFYAGFQINDHNVISTNNTPTSQPQEDDDIEVFFETDDARADHRTPYTYQMAVSANNGAYFSVGNDTAVPTARTVYTYKYAATVDGTLNNPADTDTGYTIELAIPWQELGRDGPPHAGDVWGFNAISRERDSMDTPADKFYSLSEDVKSGADVQDPSDWTKIIFEPAGTPITTSQTLVYCPRVTERFPLINGAIMSGEWPEASRLSWGFTGIKSPAPTMAEEPNTTESPFAEPPTQAAQPASVPPTPVQPAPPPVAAVPAPAPAAPTSIPLPHGGSIKIVRGAIPIPAVPTSEENPPGSVAPGTGENPLTSRLPTGYEPPPTGVSFTGSLSLGPSSPPKLVMAVYRIDFNGDPRLGKGQNIWDDHGQSLLIDQPMNGAGPWFSGLRPSWHEQQLTDIREAGINVALIKAEPGDDQIVPELDSLVAALKDMKASGVDYPLIGVDAHGLDQAGILQVLGRIPAEFRAEWPTGQDGDNGALIYDADPSTVPDKLLDGAPVAVLAATDVSTVSPGGRAGDGSLAARKDGDTYHQSWQAATSAQAETVVLNSWNDFTAGTDLAPSRQYGEFYVDHTKLGTLQYNGDKQWHAKYLSYSVPRKLRPRVLYTVSLRIENAGSLPWRAGEDYSLCPRWYRDGRLFDDSAPRVPLAHDVFPGQSATINVGLVAMNAYGDDLDPGDYVLVFDMVQGQDKWFSYASDTPLEIPVTVVAASDPPVAKEPATFLGASTPVCITAGLSAGTTVTVRNDGDVAWDDGYKLAYKLIVDGPDGAPRQIMVSQGVALGDHAIQPGEITTVNETVGAVGADGLPLAPGPYRIRWFIVNPALALLGGSYDEGLEVVPSAVMPSFVLSDIPRDVGAGKEFPSRLAVRNLGSDAWTKGSISVGYHWYYLDGVEAAWDGGTTTPLDADVPPDGVDDTLTAKATAPELPGRYILAWDVLKADGKWASTAPESMGDNLLPVIITVSGKSSAVPVDIDKYAATVVGDPAFLPDGSQLPIGMLPPDGAGEVDVNPLMLGKPGPALYPSGYYAGSTGTGWQSNHAVPFLYSTGAAHDGIACDGQRVDLPPGPCREIHVLAAVADADPVTANFGVIENGNSSPSALTVSSWKSAPTQAAWFSPYSVGPDGSAVDSPCYLGDYTIDVPADQNVSALVLPNSSSIKVFAVTLVR
jgi:hypothetical protein